MENTIWDKLSQRLDEMEKQEALENLMEGFINQVADDDDWDSNRVKQLAGFIRLWKDLQLIQAPSITPEQIAEALELVAAEIRQGLEQG